MINDIVPGSPSSDLLLTKNRKKNRKSNHKLRRKIGNKSYKECSNNVVSDTSLPFISNLELNKNNDIKNTDRVPTENSVNSQCCQRSENDQIFQDYGPVCTALNPKQNILSSSSKIKFSYEESFSVTDTELFQIGEAADAVMEAHKQNITFLNKSYNDPYIENSPKTSNTKTIVMDILNDFNESLEEVHSPPLVLLKSDCAKTYSRKVTQNQCARKLAYSPTNSSGCESIALSDHDFKIDRALSDFDNDSSESVYNEHDKSFIDMNETSKIGENLSQLSFLLLESPEPISDNNINIKDSIELSNINRNFLNHNDSSSLFKGLANKELNTININDIDKQSSCKHTLVQRFDTITNSLDNLYLPGHEVDKIENNTENNEIYAEEQQYWFQDIYEYDDLIKPQSMEWTSANKENENIDIYKCDSNSNSLSKNNNNEKANKILIEETNCKDHLDFVESVSMSAPTLPIQFNSVDKNLPIIKESAAQKIFNDKEITNFDNYMAKSVNALKVEKNNNTLHYKDEFKRNAPALSVGFSAASGKYMAVSDEALNIAQKMFNNCNDEIIKSKEFVRDEEITNFDNNNMAEPVNVGKKENLNNNDEFKRNLPVLSVGFSAASGKYMAVSDEALNIAQKMFNDCNDEIIKFKAFVRDEKITNFDNIYMAESVNVLNVGKKEILNNIDEVKRNVPVLSVGFSAASGKHMAVSEKALKNAQKMFNDCNDEIIKSKAFVRDEEITNFDDNNMAEPVNVGKKENLNNKDEFKRNVPVLSVGFSAASGKYMAVSDEALNIAQKMFNDCNDEIIKSKAFVRDEKITNFDNIYMAESVNVLNVGKKEILNNIDEFKRNVPVLSVGFSAASGKHMAVSEKALKNAQKMFNDCNDEIIKSKAFVRDEEISNFDDNNMAEPVNVGKKENLNNKDEFKRNVPVLSVGFSAASGKYMAVSEKALKNAQKMFNDCNDEIIKSKAFVRDEEISNFDDNNMAEPVNVGKKENLNNKDVFKRNVPVLSVGFSAASGKYMAVSDEALNIAQKMFNDCNDEIIKSKAFVRDEKITNFDNIHMAESVNVLNVGKKEILNNIDEFKRNVPVLSVGFSAASGKYMAVSEKALKNAQKMFNDCNDEIIKSKAFFRDEEISNFDDNNMAEPVNVGKKENLNNKDEFKRNVPVLSVGFSAASGKYMAVSDEALNIAQKMFNDCNNEIIKSKAFVRDEKITNFDDNYMAESVNILNVGKKEILNNIDEFKRNAPVLSVGFSAASGKQMAVSEKALKNAQKMFNDCNDEIIKSKAFVRDEEITNFDNYMAEPVYALKVGKKEILNNNDEFKSNVPVLSVGFSAASGKHMAVSDEALKAAQNMFKDCNDEIIKSKMFDRDEIIFKFDDNYRNETVKALYKDDQVVSKYNIEEPITNIYIDDCNEYLHEGAFVNNICNNMAKTLPVSRDAVDNERIKTSLNNLNSNSLPISYEGLENAQKLVDEIDRDDYFLSNFWNTDLTNNFFEPIGNAENMCVFNGKNDLKSPVKTTNINKDQFLINMASTSTPKAISIVGKNSTPKNNSINISMSQEINASTHALLEDEFFSSFANGKENLIKPGREIKSKQGKQQCLYSKFDTMETVSDYETPKRRINNNEIEPIAKRQKSIIYSCIENISASVKNERLNAEIEQCLFINNKTKDLKRPSPGIVYLNKSLPNRQKLIDYVKNSKPMIYSFDELIKFGLCKNTINATVENALDFKFDLFDFLNPEICNNNTKGIELHENIILLMDENSHAGITQIQNCFLAAPGVDPSIVPKGWVENSYKWIVSKLASMERSFPKYFSAKALTPQNVILQMKYRYDLEIDNSKRSVLRKILERDNASSKRMVLFVSQIKKKLLDYYLELSDGWYSINAEIDTPLNNYVKSGKIKIGTKLVIQGADLINNDQGCSPLEMPDNVKLKIYANSTRRVRWNTKLGYCKNASNLPISLNSIISKGGQIGSVNVFILRMYPMMYVEKTKGEKGSILRSERVEKRKNSLNENMNSNNIEILYSQVKKEIAEKYNKLKKNKKHFKNIKVSDITDASELYDLLQNSNDPEAIEQDMSAIQKELVKTYQSRIQADFATECEEIVKERLESLNQYRSVCPLLKIRIIDALVPKSSMVLSIWRPDENILKLLKENIFVSLFNISASRSHSNGIQLSAGIRTIYKILDKTKFTTPTHLCRIITPISDITNNFSPNFNEFDTVGIVVFISEAAVKQFQSIYIADDNYNILCINFWNGLKEYAYDDIVQLKSILGISNLKWRFNMPVAFATEFTKITEKTKGNQFSEVMENLTLIMATKDIEEYICKCNEKINEVKARKLINSLNSKENAQGNTTPLRERKYGNVTTPKNAMHLSNSILETPKEFSPGVGQPTMSIQNRIELLQKYGEPSELSPLVTKSSNSLKRKYTVPRRI